MTSFDFDVMAFYKEELSSDSKVTRQNAISEVKVVAHALGAQPIVSELIPFLATKCKEEPHSSDEEFLFGVAEALAHLAEKAPGQQTLDLVVTILEALAEQEETVVRDAAVKSLSTIMDANSSQVPDLLFPVLKRLAEKDWFTARCSACGLFPVAYKYGTEDQKTQLRKMYGTLCSEDTPMVRRAAANKFQDFVAVIEKQGILQDIIPVFRLLSQEETQDTIRVACINTCITLAGILSADELKQHVVQVIVTAVEDRSWRVRLTVARSFDQLCKAFGPEITAQSFLNPLVALLKDQELEVRTQSVKVIEPCIKHIGDQLQTYILPQFQTLALDPSQQVRAAVALMIGPLAKTLGKDVTQKVLLPLITDLMKDEFHDVRLNSVSHAGLICEVLGMDSQTHTLLNTIQGLIMDNQWRIRCSVVEQVPKLARHFGPEMFQSKLESLFISSLTDSVHSVRVAATDQHKEIALVFGAQWTVEHLLPKLVDQYSQNSGYSHRVTTLQVLPQVAHVMTPNQIVQFVVPLLINATKDSVPNVRFCACQKIKYMIDNHNLPAASISSVIRPALSDLHQDPDTDVRYYASLALKAAGA